MIIVFVGLPGSGKTTQIYLLSKMLRTRGQKARVLCLRRGFTASFMEKILYILIYGKRIPYPYPLELLLRGAKSKLEKIIHLWCIINVFELYGRVLLVLLLSKAYGAILLVEDYIPAAMLDYAYVAIKLGIPIDKIRKYIKALTYLYLKAYPSKVIVLKATIQELAKRWHKRGRAEHSYIYISIFRHILPKLISRLMLRVDKDVIYLDTTNKSVYGTLKALIHDLSCLKTEY